MLNIMWWRQHMATYHHQISPTSPLVKPTMNFTGIPEQYDPPNVCYGHLIHKDTIHSWFLTFFQCFCNLPQRFPTILRETRVRVPWVWYSPWTASDPWAASFPPSFISSWASWRPSWATAHLQNVPLRSQWRPCHCSTGRSLHLHQGMLALIVLF